ncbi:MAG: HAMP domain-containing sensor histidine kinase [Flavitalea sp.]
MKIRNRLSFEFTLLAAGVMLLVMALVYFVFANYMKREFYARLNDRAVVTGNVYLERDELTRRSFQEIQKRFTQGLPGEQALIFDEKDNQTFTTDTTGLIDIDMVRRIRQEGQYQFTVQNRQAVGINYEDNQGNFVIVIAAKNVLGRAQLNNLLIVLGIAYLTGLGVVFLLSKRFASNALKPIVHINAKINQIQSSNLHQRIEVEDNKDEINEVADNFNALLVRLEHSFDLQRSFVNNASHELRTPLTAIVGELEVMLSRARTTEEYQQTMKSVLAESEKLTRILNQLFELSSYEGNESDIRYTQIPLVELYAGIEQEWAAENLIIKSDVSDDQPLVVHGNQLLIETALRNVIKNAIKFSADKPVEISLNVHDQYARFSVCDHGIGIKSADLPHIFEPFFRAENARSFAGTGIGLSIAKKITEVHKGSITVASEPGEKTCFHIFLPVIPAF